MTAPAETDTSRAGYLRRLSGLLWPAPATVTICRARAPGRPYAEYLLVPGAERPKMLVPAGRRAAAAAVVGFNAERSPRAAALSRVLRTALRTGAAHPLLRDRLRVHAGGARPDTIETHLAAVLGTPDAPPLLGLQIGPARANRKPVAQLITADGRTLGFTKIGVNALTGALVTAEARALAVLNEATTRAMTVPAVRHTGRWHDLELLTQDALPVWRERAPVTWERLTTVMLEIADIAGVTTGPLTAAPYWKGLRDDAAALGDGPRAEQVRHALDLIGAGPGPELAFGSWHGDFALWNIAVLPETVLVWDWERFTTGVPRGYDALHYHFQDATATRGRPHDEAVRDTLAEAPRLLAPFGHTGDDADLVALLYLCDIAVRYLRDRQDEAGARLGRIEEWLLPELLGRAARR
ncbi:MAG TPA: aminoglycoside phosphotransferase [Streptosporangiaceae bacterium]|jgi:hypothetical protein